MTMQAKCFSIRPLTNLHVGAGGDTYGIVDKQVQRDPVTEMPIIHASSLKGALREFFTNGIDYESGSKDKEEIERGDLIEYIFGSRPQESDESNNKIDDSDEENDSNNEKKTRKSKKNDKRLIAGAYRFFDAHLLFLPVRSNKKPFFLATCPMLITNALEKAKLILGEAKIPELFNQLASLHQVIKDKRFKSPVILEGIKDVWLEDWEANSMRNDNNDDDTTKLINFFKGKIPIAFFNDTQFKELAKSLPVVARNHLENGISQNLWYEEIVPHQSYFFTFRLSPEVSVDEKSDEKEKTHAEKIERFDILFDKSLSENIIQIGANASIGYGFCELKSL